MRTQHTASKLTTPAVATAAPNGSLVSMVDARGSGPQGSEQGSGQLRRATICSRLAGVFAVLLGGAAVAAQSGPPAVNPTPHAISRPNGNILSASLTLGERSDNGSDKATGIDTFRGFAQEGSANPLVIAVPELRDLPAPKWVRAGTRLNYYWASGRNPPTGGAFWPDADGDWIDEAGKRYRQDVGTGSEGVSQVTITSVGRKTVTLDTQIYLTAETGKPPLLLLGSGSAEPSGAAADYWVNPAGLAEIPDRIGRNFASFRMPYTTGGKKYDALRIRLHGTTGSMTHIFDLATGILLHSNVINKTASGTSVSFVTYLGRRELDIPWANGDAPDWVADLQEMRYVGEQVLHVLVGEPITAPFVVAATVTGRGKNWMTYSQRVSSVPVRGQPEQTNTTTRSCGPAQLGALWIPTEGLTGVRRGQMIDNDTLTGMKTVVSRIGNDDRGRAVVEIVQDNVTQKLTFRYDRETGALVMFSRLDRRTIPSETTLTLRSVK
ncbi:MAG: hypothetical protein K8U57_06955 [Planctomycetes bacterium]|nr:hypothetical protein [Planctomycetota bacterium]